MLFPLLCAVGGEVASPFREVPATFVRNLIYVAAKDAGGKSHRLLVDTGSPTSFLRVRSPKPDEVVRLQIGRDGQSFHLTASTVAETRSGPAEGILGLDFLRRHALAIDYERSRLWIGIPGGEGASSFLRRYAASLEPIKVIPLRPTEWGHFGIQVSLNGFRGESALDTGSEGFSLITDRGEGWKLDPVGDDQITIHSGLTEAKKFLARTAKVGGFTLHAQRVTCVPPSAILFEPWKVDSLVSTSVFPSKLTIIDFPKRRLSFIPSDPAGGSALLRHLLTLPVHRSGSQFSLQGYFVNVPPVLAFQSFPLGAANGPGMNVMGRDGRITFKPAQRNAILTEVSGQPVGSIVRRYREAQNGSPAAYATILALYRNQLRAPECTLLIKGRPATFRGTALAVSPAP